MRLSRKTNTIILWVVSIGLLVGMIITFTPSLGGSNLFGGQQQTDLEGGAALLVNGQPVSELDLARARQQNRAFSAIQEGEAAADIELLLLDSLIQQEVLRQAAASLSVSSGDVRTALNDFRQAQGVDGRSNDQAYLRLINSIGYDDQGFRELLRSNLKLQRYEQGVLDTVEVSDAEAEAFYALNEASYRSEERILARMIVVDDEALAAELRQRAEDGESFADLAAESSLERADRAGALGAPAGSSEPRPVGRAALPTAVANAAFTLDGAGLTEVVEVAGRYYLVEVEELQAAATRPFTEVESEVRDDALAVKQQQALEAEIERLRRAAVVSVPEGSLSAYRDEPVARVGEVDIFASDLVRATYSNPQIQQSLNPQNAALITQLFKPSFLQNLIDLELAYQGAKELDTTFLGSHDQVAQAALAYVTRDAEASDEEIASYYQENLARYTVPATASATQVTFADAEAAAAFRAALLSGLELEGAAEAGGGEVVDLGTVGPGVLDDAVLNAALFATNAFEALPGSALEISDVLVLAAESDAGEAGGAADTAAAEGDGAAAEQPGDAGAATADEQGDPAAEGETADAQGDTAAEAAAGDDAAAGDEVVAADGAAGQGEADPAVESSAPEFARERFAVLVAERSPERVSPLGEVSSQVEAAVLSAQRTELRTAWLDELRGRIPVEDFLTAAPPEPAPSEETPVEDAAPEGEAPVEDAAPDQETPVEETPANDAGTAGEEEAPADGN